ncbi:MAG: hypothetical protein ACOCRK_06560 [bacterium]
MAKYFIEGQSFISNYEKQLISVNEIGEITNNDCPVDLVAKIKSGHHDITDIKDGNFKGAIIALNWHYGTPPEGYEGLFFYQYLKMKFLNSYEIFGNLAYGTNTGGKTGGMGEIIPDRFYFVRFYLNDFKANGYIKMWPSDEPEPDDWKIIYISNRNDFKPGIITYGIGAGEGVTKVDYDYLTLGTNDDIPDSPDVEFLEHGSNLIEIDPLISENKIGSTIELDTYLHQNFPSHLSGYNKFVKTNFERAISKAKIIKRPKRRN